MDIDSVPLNDAARSQVLRQMLENIGGPDWTSDDLLATSGAFKKLGSASAPSGIYDLWVVEDYVVVSHNASFAGGSRRYLRLPDWAISHLPEVGHALVDRITVDHLAVL